MALAKRLSRTGYVKPLVNAPTFLHNLDGRTILSENCYMTQRDCSSLAFLSARAASKATNARAKMRTKEGDNREGCGMLLKLAGERSCSGDTEST